MKTRNIVTSFLIILMGLSNVFSQNKDKIFEFSKFNYSTVDKYYTKQDNIVDEIAEFMEHTGYKSFMILNDSTVRFSKKVNKYEDINIDKLGALSFKNGHSTVTGITIGSLIGLLGGVLTGLMLIPPDDGMMNAAGIYGGAVVGLLIGGITGAVVGAGSDNYKEYDLSKQQRVNKRKMLINLGYKYEYK